MSLLTNDVLKLAEFYGKVLDTSSDDSNNDVHQRIFVDGASLTIFNDGSEKNNNNQNICIAFTVENVDYEYEKLNQLKVFNIGIDNISAIYIILYRWPIYRFEEVKE